MKEMYIGEDISVYYKDPMTETITIKYFADTYNHSKACGKLLTELHLDLQRLDFPYFFVNIVTTNKEIAKELQLLHRLHSNESHPLQYTIIKGNFIKKVYNGDTRCVLPFIHKYVNPQGLVMPCCIGDENFPIGNIKNDDLANISTKDIRETMLKGERPDACSTCWHKEDMGLESSRINVNKSWKKYNDQKNFILRHIDIRLSNNCNLKCRMCSGKFSNRIAQEEHELYGFTKYKNETLDNNLKEKVLDYILENLETIESIYFAGGEPLINKEHYDILDIFIKNNKSNIKLTYNTNFSILKFKTYNVLSLWKNFNEVELGASIDAIGKQSNYVRNGVEYEVFEKNYNQIKNLKNIKFKITSTLHMSNIFNLPNLQKRWLELGLSCEQLTFNILTNPEEQRITVLPEAFKKLAEQEIIKHINFLQSFTNSNKLINKWKDTIKFMNSRNESNFLKKFFQLTDDKDKIRNQKFEEFFPEYKNLRNYV